MKSIHEDALRDAYSSLAAGDQAGALRKIENVLESDRDAKWRREMESISEDHAKRLARLEQAAFISAPADPGPMTSHAANLTALSLWTQPDKWIDNAQSPEERARLQALLDHLHGLVETAQRGESVPLP